MKTPELHVAVTYYNFKIFENMNIIAVKFAPGTKFIF